MLLDLNMPMKSGFEVLEWVRTQPALTRLTTIVLTASLRQEDVIRTFQLGASSYLVKPSNLQALTDMVRSLNAWTKLNHFPPLNGMVVR
jgi:DNA-binding response OmpR family regulator